VSKKKKKLKSETRNERRHKALFGLVLLAAIIAAIAWMSFGNRRPSTPLANQIGKAPPASDTNSPLVPTTLTNLLLLPAYQFVRVDIGRANLLCAEGLPGWEQEDVDKGASMMEAMARQVESETKRNFYKFLNDRKAFNDSEGYFRFLATLRGWGIETVA
jgi:hypothetical protein